MTPHIFSPSIIRCAYGRSS